MKISLAILVLLSISVAQGWEEYSRYADLMPGIEVTAPRYRPEIEAYVDTMPEVIVTAPRYKLEDGAWSGLMPEVVIIAARPESEPLAHWNKREVDIKGDFDPLSSIVQ